MKSSLVSIILGALIILSCKKDDPVIPVHTGVSKVEYTVTAPFEMPHLEFTFEDIHKLSEHTWFEIEIVTSEESGKLNLMIFIEDEEGNLSDSEPINILDDMIRFDQDEPQVFSFDLNDYAPTGPGGSVNMARIKAVHIYINAGIKGKVSSGIFWLNRIAFIRNKEK